MSSKSILFLLLVISIFNPYTPIGPLAYFFVIPTIVLAAFMNLKALATRASYLVFILIAISGVGVASSYLHGIDQIEHFKVALSLLIYISFGSSIYIIFGKKNITLDDLVLYSFLAVTLNSIVILAQVVYPSFRAILEGYLVGSGNIDWADGFRYRGLASGGGASLSILTPVAMVMGLYLFQSKIINSSVLVFCGFICIWALFFIGRTGVLLLPIAFLTLLFSLKLNSAFKIFSVILIFVLGFVLLQDELKLFLTEAYGDGFYNYSLGFFLEGSDGLKNEGTVGMIAEFLSVVPTTFPEILIGYGFYGGSDFFPWTDSGYARMLLSVGYIFGAMFYAVLGFIYFRPVKYKPYLFASFILILLIAEAKEPLLASGYAARLLYVLIGFSALEIRYRANAVKLRSISKATT